MNQIPEQLAECGNAQTILRATGHGAGGTTFADVARTMPDRIDGNIKRLFNQRFIRSYRVWRGSGLSRTPALRSAWRISRLLRSVV